MAERQLMWGRAWIFAPLLAAVLVLGAAVWVGGQVGFLADEIEVEPFELDGISPRSALPETEAVAAEEPDAEPPESNLEAQTRELKYRITWALTVIALLLALTVSLTVPWILAHRSLEPLGRRRQSVIWGAAGIAVAACLFVGLGDRVVLPHMLQSLVEQLPGSVKQVRELLKGLSAAAMFTLFFAIGTTLTPAASRQDVAHLAAQTRRLRYLLFVGAGLLAAGVLEIGALLHWPTVRIPAVEAVSVSQLADVVTTASGTLFTLLLLAPYGLASTVLAARVDELARGAVEEPDKRQKWLTHHGLDSTFLQHFLRVLAVLAPFAAGGPLSGLIDALIR